jgi:hypothetical protein
MLWKDVMVLVDDGRADPADYATLGDRVAKELERHPQGLGALTLVPVDAKPLPPEVRRAVGELLVRLSGSLRCAAWVVESRGFEGAMVRGVLTGVRLFGRYPYPTHVSTELEEALEWMMPHLAGGATRRSDVPTVARFIRSQRASASPGGPH